jgi:hypothetical protein
MLNKTEILSRVDTIASKRLFVDGKWLADNKTVAIALNKILKEFGLVETLPNGDETSTKLGKELDAELQLVFMGVFEPWDAISVLQDQNLITENEVEDLSDLLETDECHYEPLLRARVQQAYRDYHHAERVH